MKPGGFLVRRLLESVSCSINYCAEKTYDAQTWLYLRDVKSPPCNMHWT